MTLFRAEHVIPADRRVVFHAEQAMPGAGNVLGAERIDFRIDAAGKPRAYECPCARIRASVTRQKRFSARMAHWGNARPLHFHTRQTSNDQ